MINFQNLNAKELAKAGITFKTEADTRRFADIILEELQLRIGNEIASLLTRAQLNEFDMTVDMEEAKEWLNKNCPDHPLIVRKQEEKMFEELIQYAPEIMEAQQEYRTHYEIVKR